MRIGIPDNFQGVPGLTVGGVSGVAGTVTPIPAHQDAYKDKFFQWMGGPNLGLVEKVTRTVMQGGRQVVMLESGVQLPVDEFTQMLRLVEAPSTSMGNAAKPSIGPPLTPEAEALMASLKTKDNMPVVNTPNNAARTPSNEQNTIQPNIQSSAIIDDPVLMVLSKKKECITTVNCTLNLDLPKQALFDMLIDDFEKTPEEILQLIIDDKNIKMIKEQLIAILLNHYGKEPTPIKIEPVKLNEAVSQYELDAMALLDQVAPVKQEGESDENKNPL